MFTGMIEAVGNLLSITPMGDDVRVHVQANNLDMSDVSLGDSIATNGVCLTVVEFNETSYQADLSLETLQRTGFDSYQVGAKVNLEKAMLAKTRFGGHIVSGHVDDIGEVITRTQVGRAIEYWIQPPLHLMRYIAEKGSIALDGVSLTVNAVSQSAFKITIVPHTSAQTTIADLSVGSQVNLEVDMIARYLEQLMKPTTEQKSSITMDFLSENGFL